MHNLVAPEEFLNFFQHFIWSDLTSYLFVCFLARLSSFSLIPPNCEFCMEMVGGNVFIGQQSHYNYMCTWHNVVFLFLFFILLSSLSPRGIM